MSAQSPTSSQNSGLATNLVGKKVLLGISGSIAAYKAAELVRQLRKSGAEVQVVMTSGGGHFITPLTLQTLSERPVYSEAFDQAFEAEIGHIKLARWPDLIAIYPASANCIAKLAHGMADDLLTTLVLASEAPIMIAPAMNSKMWLNPSTQHNISQLRHHGKIVLCPASGVQACHEEGPGRLIEPDEMLAQIVQQLTAPLLKDKTLVITAGPTREPLDPVRYLSNGSSGKMGYALAQAAARAGANTILISGPSTLDCPLGVKRICVTTTEQMYQAAINVLPCDIFIAAAAPANYRPATYSDSKIKATQPSLAIELVANRDILQTVAHHNACAFSVGFAAETEDHITQAQAKLKRKGADMIIANHISANWPMGCDDNQVTAITRGGEQVDLERAAKSTLASQLITLIAEKYYTNLQSPAQLTV